jgi:hypothetical protein
MTKEHPITPPPELVDQWVQATESNDCIGAFPTNFEKRICTAAARWGADQELEACCEWVEKTIPSWAPHTLNEQLRAARRPKPPSLKEQALTALSEADQGLNESEWQQRSDTIRRALEQLDD